MKRLLLRWLGIVVLCSFVLVAASVGVWYWLYGTSHSISADKAKIEIEKLVGDQDLNFRVEEAAHLRRFDAPDSYYYLISLDGPEALQFVDRICRLWVERGGACEATTDSLPGVDSRGPKWWSRWSAEDVEFCDLIYLNGSTRIYNLGFSRSKGQVRIVHFKF